MVCAPQIPVAAIMPQHGASWNAEDWSEKAEVVSAAAEAIRWCNPPIAAQKNQMKIRKKLREIVKIEEMAAAGAKVDPLQRHKLAQKEALIALRDEAECAIAEEEDRVATEQRWQRQQHNEQQVQQHESQHGLKKEQQQPEDQLQLFHQVTAKVTQSPSLAPYSWIPVTQVQLFVAFSPVCDEHGQQVQELQLVQTCPILAEQPAMVEHLQVPLQAWTFQQQEDQQQWQEQQRLHMQLQSLPQLHISKEHSVSSQVGAIQYGFHQQPAMEVRLDVPKERHEDAASLAPISDRIDMLMESLNGDNDAKRHALDSLRGSVVNHAFNPQGCRAVQLAFQVADTRVAAELLSELRGHVQAASRSLHANYVIQRAIEVITPAGCGFIAQEMRGVGAAVARHRFGCRILCRLLEHMADNPACVELIAEVMAEAGQLCRQEFGHYVMQSVLEHGQPQQRGCLVQALVLQGPRLANHNYGSHVIETALVHGSAEEQQDIGAALLTLGSCGMVALALTQHGSFVARALLRTSVDAALAAAVHFRRAAAQLKRNRYGRRVLEEVSQQSLRVA